MLKIKLVAFLFCLISTIANAEPFTINRAIVCNKIGEVFKLIPNFGEQPVWQGKNDKDLITILTLNLQTQTWTVIITNGEHACILDTGKEFRFDVPQPRVEKNKLTDILNKYKI